MLSYSGGVVNFDQHPLRVEVLVMDTEKQETETVGWSVQPPQATWSMFASMFRTEIYQTVLRREWKQSKVGVVDVLLFHPDGRDGDPGEEAFLAEIENYLKQTYSAL